MYRLNKVNRFFTSIGELLTLIGTNARFILFFLPLHRFMKKIFESCVPVHKDVIQKSWPFTFFPQSSIMNMNKVLCHEVKYEVAHSSPTSSVTSSTSDVLERGWIAPFLLHLHQLLRRESDKIVQWTADGKAFQILDKEALTNNILPKYFKNKNFASFQRQLNYFGFRKWSKSRAPYSTYSREHFTRDNYSAMSLVKRQSKKSGKRKCEEIIDKKDNKRPALPSVWTIGDRCKPIRPRPELLSCSEHSKPIQPTIVDLTIPIASSWTRTYPIVVPRSYVKESTLPTIPVLSAARQVPSGCKLPSIRELPMTGMLLCGMTTRPQWLA